MTKLVENTISDPARVGGGDVVTETVTILRESVDSVTRESSIGGNAGVETKLISTSTISQQVTESDGSVTATATIDSAIFEEVTNMGKKIIDETLEKVQVHMAKVVELEHTDLTSAEDLKAIGQVIRVLQHYEIEQVCDFTKNVCSLFRRVLLFGLCKT